MRIKMMYVLSSMMVIPMFTIHVMAYAAHPVPSAQFAPQTTPASRPAAAVRIDNFRFEPKDLTIQIGTTVTWTNADDVPHTASSKGEAQVFDSGAMDTDDTFSFTFSKAGKYEYFCKIHPHMTGMVTVK